MPVALLGGLNIENADKFDTAPLTRKAKLVLAILCLFDEQGVARSSLAEMVWPDRSDSQSRTSLRQALSALRKALPAILHGYTIESTNDKLVLTGPPEMIDTRIFQQLVVSDSRSDWILAAARYKGDLLDGIQTPDRLRENLLPLQMKLRKQALDLCERLSADFKIAEDGKAECEELANRLLAADPAAEEAHRAIIRLRLGKGQFNSARKQLEICTAAVRKELGTEPEAATLQMIDEFDSDALELEIADEPQMQESRSENASSSRTRNVDLFLRPAVLFLPFEALSQSEEDALLASGLCEDIRTTLACWRSFPVIGPEALGGATGDIQNLAAGVDATYAVTGSVRRAGNRARVTARLIDASSGQELWSQTFDGNLEDVFEFQDEISRRIVSQIEPEISHATAQRIPLRRPKDLATWELLAKAVDAERRGGDGYGTPEANDEQRVYVSQAIEQDPELCEAWARLGRCYFRDFLLGWVEDTAAALERSLEATARAVEIDPGNSIAQAFRAQSMLFGKHDPQGAFDHARDAIRLNPSNVMGHYMMGCTLVYCGDPVTAYDHYETVLRLNPAFSGKGALFCDQMMCRALVGDLDDAIQFARKTIDIAPRYLRGLQRCAAVLAHADKCEEATEILRQIDELGGAFSETYVRETYPFVRSEDLDFLVTGLRKAGWKG